MLRLIWLVILIAPAFGQDPPSEETIEFFSRNCQSCHTIGGGKLTGPDLKGLDGRRDRDWSVRFMLDPKGVIDAGGEYERELLQASRGVYMPPIPTANRELAGKLYDLIVAESALEKSRFAGVQVSDRPLGREDVERGRRLFLGQEVFQEGGPACVSCHTTAGIGGLGGGILGPDLTAAYARLEGRTALGAWLSAPPSPVMQPVYAEHALEGEEILAIVALLQEEARSGQSQGSPRTLPFVMAGIALAAGVLVLFDYAWKRRFQGVRRRLVHGGRIA